MGFQNGMKLKWLMNDKKEWGFETPAEMRLCLQIIWTVQIEETFKKKFLKISSSRCVKTALPCTGTQMYTRPAGEVKIPENSSEHEIFEHPNLLCIVKQAVSSPLHSSQTKILCKYFLLGQVLIFRPQERLLQLYLLQRVHGHLDGGQGDPAEGCPVHKVKQDFQTCLLKISNIIVERSNPHNFTFDYFSLYHYFIFR